MADPVSAKRGNMADKDKPDTELALLSQRLELFIETEEKAREEQSAAREKQNKKLDRLMDLISDNKTDTALNKQRIVATEKAVAAMEAATDRLNNKFNAFSGVNSFLGVIATSLAIFFGVNR